MDRETIAALQEKVEAWLETIEILKDEELMAAFRQCIRDLEEGRIIPWEDVKKEPGLE